MASSARIDELRKKFDENPRRYFAPLANEFRKAGETEQAIMICEEFLPQQPGHMSGHIVYGQALYEVGRLEESRTVFETALTLDPENLIALRHLGDISRSQGDSLSARRWYDRVLEADPRNDEIQQLIGSLTEVHSPAQDAEPEGTRPEIARPSASALPGFTPAMPRAELAQSVIPAAMPTDLPTVLPTDVPMAAEAPSDRSPADEGRAPDHALMDMEIDDAYTGADPAPHAAPTPAMADGFESSEFTPPAAGAPASPLLLDGTIEAGEFTAPSSSIAPLDGLEDPYLPHTSGSSISAPSPRAGDEVATRSAPPLDLDDEMILSSRQREVEPSITARGPSPRGEIEQSADAPAGSLIGSESTSPIGAASSFASPVEDLLDLPLELPPSVIAAEAELIDARTEAAGAPVAPPPSGGDLDEPSSSRVAAAPFVTETMAELYLKQGFRVQALDVYRQLAAASPRDARLRQRVADLETDALPVSTAAFTTPLGATPAQALGATPAQASEPEAGPSVREFFARLANRRAATTAASSAPPTNDDFAQFEAIPSTPAPAPAAVGEQNGAATPPVDAQSARVTPSSSVPASARSVTPAKGGSIDALFGSRPQGGTEDSAASALAQAFGGAAEIPLISGRPARAAAGELSLDSVFRDAPARASRSAQNFSFDQFFSESATGDSTPPGPAHSASEGHGTAEPPERSPEDIEQFNSWLQGLKQR